MSTAKRRRYLRYEIRLEATLVINDSSSIKGMVQDFCSGGLFVELQQNDVKRLSLHQKIQIHFSVSLAGGGEDFKVAAKIRHIRENGIGVTFENNATAAFEILKKEAQLTVGLISVDRRSNPVSLAKQKKLEADLAALLQEKLPAVMQSFFQCLRTKLTEAAERVENLEYSAVLLDAITNLEMNKDILFEKFCGIAGQKSCHLTLSSADKIEESHSETSLSLIDKNEFEDWLNLSASIRKLNSRHETQLEQIQKKMAYIIGVDSNAVINPASPQILCDRFRDALTGIEENAVVKRRLYVLFEKILVELLSDLYDRIDIILLQHGAPNKIADVNSWKKTASGARSTDHSAPKSEQTTHIPRLPSKQKATGDSTELSARLKGAAQYPRPVVSVASNLLNLLQGQLEPEHASSSPASVNASVYSADEISEALDQLQENSANNGALHDVFQKKLLNTLQGFSDTSKNLSSADKKILEVHESLFETLFNDMSLNNNIQSYLKSIYLPVMAQALLDPNFLESDNHPARNIVNHLAWLESSVKENKIVYNTHIRQTLDHLVEQIAHESLNNPAVFASVEQQLNDITQTVNKSVDHNIKRVTEVYEGKQKLEKARESVHAEIDRLFAGESIPKIIISLLEAGWQHLLVITKLNESTHDPNFQNYLQMLNDLNDWLKDPERANREQVKSALEIIDTQLQSVCTNTFLHQKILNDLKAVLLAENTPSSSAMMEMVPFEPYQRTQLIRQVINRTDEASQLKVGEWLTFILEDVIEPLKLAWIGEALDTFVFVNRNGLKKLEFEREELSEMIRNGGANRIESLDLPIMDRATNKMLQKMHEKLMFNATHDPVTGLSNRKEFIKQLKQELSRLDNAQHVLCNIEVQDFRIITNACGPAGGDALLRQLADLLKNHMRESEIVARLSDKTFSILLKCCSAEAADDIAKKLQSQFIDNHFEWQDKSYAIGASIGMVPFNNIGIDVNSLLQRADSVTLSAKNAGRNRIRIYDEDDQLLKDQDNIHEWAGRIDQVFANERLFIRCQKIASIGPETKSHAHYEILLGIKDDNGNIIAPDDFIPAVERCQRMSEIDRWVVLEVFAWIEQHPSEFEMLDGFAINLSGESLNSEEFLEFLKHTLDSTTVPLEKITFEVTETVAANSFSFTQHFIRQVKSFNCKLSLDDFGSGYSSYSYLKSLDVDYLKIDGAFVKDILNNNADIAIVRSINEIAHSLGLQTIAEYVENDEIHALLREIGVDYAQGWGIQKPILLSDLAKDTTIDSVMS